MSNEVKKQENTQKQSMVEITFVNAVVEKGGKVLDELLEGKRILEYSLQEAELTISLEDNAIDKDGNRFDPKTGQLLGIKGKIKIPEKMKKEWEAKRKSEDISLLESFIDMCCFSKLSIKLWYANQLSNNFKDLCLK